MLVRENQEPIIELKGAWHTYPGPQKSKGLQGVDLEIGAGEYVAIIGANGSGKSTLARHLNGLLLPDQGFVRVGGIDTHEADRLGEIRQRLQMIFQQPDAQIVATVVEEDVAFGPENFGVPSAEIHERVRAALETVGMWELRNRPPHRLSAGQKQRVAIAGALAVKPEIIVLDEATAMLDPAGRAAVLELLRSLHAAGTTILTITHEMDEAAEAGRVIVLNQGRIVMDQPPREVFARPVELRTLGLDVPIIADLANRLGLPVCLSVNELLHAIGNSPGVSALPEQESGLETSAPDAAAPLIQVRDLQHTYLRGTPFETVALQGVSLDVGRGAALGLIGQTGSGKSTLMQHFNGLMRPQTGQVIVDGMDWADPAIKVSEARRKVGLLFQQPEDQLFERYIGDDIAFGPRQQGLSPAEVRERVQAAMAAVGLGFEDFKDRAPEKLSGGERRRAALAGVLAIRPQALVVDEPTAGLDPRGREEILAILRGLNREGITVVMASHRMSDVAALCQQVVALKAGKVVTSGSARDVLGRVGGEGLPVTPAAELAAHLRAGGWPIPDGVFTLDELESALRIALLRAAAVSTHSGKA